EINPLVEPTALRTSWCNQVLQQVAGNNEVWPLNPAADAGSGPCTPTVSDPMGSFGPRQAYGPPPAMGYYVVDMTDCVLAPTDMAGMDLGAGSGNLKYQPFYCVLTARTRISVPTLDGQGNAVQRVWAYGSSNVQYQQDPYAAMHESRAV